MNSSNRSDREELIAVTGASTGIGAASARELARKGFHVLAGVRRAADAQALVAEGLEPVILDITEESNVAAIADRVARDPLRRPLRALVNNAGIAINAPVETLPIAEWRKQFEVNLFGHIAMTQALLPALLVSSGTIVNISSVGGKVVLPTYGAYAGSKFRARGGQRRAAPRGQRCRDQGRRRRTRRRQDRDGRAWNRHRGGIDGEHDRRPARTLRRSRRGRLGTSPIVWPGRRFGRTRRKSDRQGRDRT